MLTAIAYVVWGIILAVAATAVVVAAIVIADNFRADPIDKQRASLDRARDITGRIR